jgi:hypothetical protein
MLPKSQGQSTSVGPHLKGLLFATPGPSVADWAPADLPAEQDSGVAKRSNHAGGGSIPGKPGDCFGFQTLRPGVFSSVQAWELLGWRSVRSVCLSHMPWPLRDVHASSAETRRDVQPRANALGKNEVGQREVSSRRRECKGRLLVVWVPSPPK